MLARSIQSISDIKFKDIKLQRGQFIFLTRVCENPGINQIDLSNILKVDKATTTKAMQKLIDEGYIVKERDEKDKRMWRLFPTDQAKRVYPMIIDEENRNIAVCFANFSEQEKLHVYNLVKKMRANIEEDWKKLKNF
ncbi:MarR family transcriptional regulator [bacterium BFN5]|nr:MarR family transcriptional regulator [bacterium BFN5]QJW49008.1 MarR family transcriptional regulator [bacterium BFN5]